MMRLAVHIERMEKRDTYRLLIGKPEGRRPLERPRYRWLNNSELELVVIGWGHMAWIGLVRNGNKRRALLSVVMNLRSP
jgi:hypothetical protein